MTCSRIALLGVAVSSVLTVAAQGAFVIQPVVAPGTGYAQTSMYAYRSAEYMANGNGLSDSTIVQTGDSIPALWPSHVNTEGGGTVRWQANGEGNNAAVALDLGAYYNLTSMHIWNMNEAGWNTSRGVNTATVYALPTFALGQDGDQNFPVANLSGPSNGVTLTGATGLSTYTGEDIALSLTNVRYIGIKVDTAMGGYVALDEVRFVGTEVPEPTSLGLLALGGMALLGRRRK